MHYCRHSYKLLMMKVCLIFIALALLIGEPSHAQDMQGKWTPYTKAASGDGVYYRPDMIKRQNFPPTSIKVPVLFDSPKTRHFWAEWELRCASKEILVANSKAISVADQSNSLLRIFLEGLCGMRDDTGLWFIVGPNASGNFLAVNSDSVQVDDKDNFQFVLTSVNIDASSPPQIEPKEKASLITINCAARSKATSILTEGGEEQQVINVAPWTAMAAAQDLLCSGFLPIKRKRDTAPPVSKDTNGLSELRVRIDKAKKTCIELGFKESTERFSDCVLTISK